MLRVLDISEGTSVDGPGLRTSIYFAGCNHRCEGCHNPQSWDFGAGTPMTDDEIVEVVERNGFNVTFTGGDPMYLAAELLPLARRLKQLGYNIWCYTGFLFEELIDDPERRTLLEQIDVVVDGPFSLAQRDISLRFRGSSNQRLIAVEPSLAGDLTLWSD
jgi:anaerobic ribonucleoside-triphosphate reductase activating protein